MWNRFASAVPALACLCSAAHADIVTFSGTTVGSPTFNRPLEDFSGLSSTGTNVRYDVTHISVSAPGSYTFETAATFDNFALLYSTFDPAMPLTNTVAANDDLVAPPFTTSGFSATLAAGLDYIFVNTGFAETDLGAFASTIGGPGLVTVGAIPSLLPDGFFVHTGNTMGGPTFNRPLEDLSGLSAIGTNVAYDRFDFTVALGGDYVFLTTGDFDTFSILYATDFIPSTPLLHSEVANDDLIPGPTFTTSGFADSLVAGVRYSLITTGFDATTSGAGEFSVLVAVKPVAIAAVAEPEAPALFLAGLAAMRWLVRRRRA